MKETILTLPFWLKLMLRTSLETTVRSLDGAKPMVSKNNLCESARYVFSPYSIFPMPLLDFCINEPFEINK